MLTFTGDPTLSPLPSYPNLPIDPASNESAVDLLIRISYGEPEPVMGIAAYNFGMSSSGSA